MKGIGIEFNMNQLISPGAVSEQFQCSCRVVSVQIHRDDSLSFELISLNLLKATRIELSWNQSVFGQFQGKVSAVFRIKLTDSFSLHSTGTEPVPEQFQTNIRATMVYFQCNLRAVSEKSLLQ